MEFTIIVSYLATLPGFYIFDGLAYETFEACMTDVINPAMAQVYMSEMTRHLAHLESWSFQAVRCVDTNNLMHLMDAIESLPIQLPPQQ